MAPESEPESPSDNPEPTEALQDANAVPEAKGVLEVSSTGRAKCRACGEAIAKAALRVGAILPNPFAEGETTFWFHPECAARRMPGAWLAALESADATLAAPLLPMRAAAERRVEHRRLSRITALEWAPSGRARCRQCRETIDKHTVRAVLTLFNSGRFDPIGYTHLACLDTYVGTSVEAEDVSHLVPNLPEPAKASIESRWGNASG